MEEGRRNTSKKLNTALGEEIGKNEMTKNNPGDV